MYRPVDDSSGFALAAGGDATETSDKKNKCKEKWRMYRESQACFAQYRTVNGGVRPEALSHALFGEFDDVPQGALCYSSRSRSRVLP